MNDTNRSQRVAGFLMNWRRYLLYLMVFVGLIVALRIVFRDGLIQLFGQQTQGVVVAYSTSTTGASNNISVKLGPGASSTFIVVAYSDESRVSYQLHSMTASDPPLFALGEYVPIVYPRGDSANGRIRSFREFAATLLFFFTMCVAAFVLFVLRFLFKLLFGIAHRILVTGRS